MGKFVATLNDQEQKEEALAVAALATANSKSKERKRADTPNVLLRMKIWSQFGTDFSKLSGVVQKLLTCHATSCATERNWSLWGCVYTSSRNALSGQRK
jgi:hypothetical protein